MSLLNVSNLNVVINNQVILHDINFSLNKGDTLMILGPNGAGKSTLLRALIHHNKGVKWFTNKVSYLPPPDSINRFELPPILVKEFVSIVGIKKSLINEFNINLSLRVNNLSSGQFQKLMLAWALTSKPDVLLLDEPMSGIDVSGERTFFELIHDQWLNGLTIIMVTHDLDIIWKHANKVLCLNKEVLCKGNPRVILTPSNLRRLYNEEISFYKHNHGGA